MDRTGSILEIVHRGADRRDRQFCSWSQEPVCPFLLVGEQMYHEWKLSGHDRWLKGKETIVLSAVKSEKQLCECLWG